MGKKKKHLAKTVLMDSHDSGAASESNEVEMPAVENAIQSVNSIEIKEECDIKLIKQEAVEVVDIPASTYRNAAHAAGRNEHQGDNDFECMCFDAVKVEVKQESDVKEPKKPNTNDFDKEASGDQQNQPPMPGGDDRPNSLNDGNNIMERGDGAQSKPHKCESCEYSTRYKSHLKRHLLKHTGEKPHRCDYCPKRFTQKHYLRAHMKIHVEVYLFHCHGCLQGFDQKDEKTAHETSCKIIRYECHLCKESFGSNNTNMIGYMRMHSGDKPFECKECFKQFARKSTLNDHMKLHAGPRSVNCTKCHQTFLQEEERNVHEQKCQRQLHECDVCGKSFGLNKSHLIDHMRTHTGEKPFKCKECAKKFTQKAHLNSHMKTHSEDKSFQCKLCGHTSAWKSSLKQHMKTIHNKER